ncbi:HlyD family type I secretion periplasmic adaptor subunit [Thiothrix sp.]|uniref:HlyD family type I secretion periplasmic adaptor subunit n=1 Tax=Thiothrix sp. TaxID=1032 RepID=UPI00257F9C80|nr:HlyD family type I secretion periplasmic adaptor subunit [Thiothrix sp.]
MKLPKEAIEFQPDAVEVDHRRLPFLARFTLYLMVATIMCAILWASFAEIDKIVSARGKLVTSARPLQIQPIKASVIKEILVKAGDSVRKGQVLAKLDTTFAQADFQQAKQKVDGMKERLTRLEVEAGVKKGGINNEMQAKLYAERKAEHEARLASLQGKIEQLRAALLSNQKDQAQASDQQDNAKTIDAMQAKLYKNGQKVSHLSYLTAHKDYLDKVQAYQQVVDKEQELRKALNTAEADLAAYQSGRDAAISQELSSSQKELADLLAQFDKAEHIYNWDTLKAPDDGIVLDVAKLSTKAVIKEAETLITLVPVGKDLEVEVEVTTTDIGKVQEQQIVRVKVDAWPFQQYGTLAGRVSTISGDAFLTQSANQADGGKNVDVVYRLKVGLSDTHLRATPEHYRLIPGMTVTAEINVGKRKVIRYFLDPLLKALDESIKEP